MGRKTEFTDAMNNFFIAEMDEYRIALGKKTLKDFWPGFLDRFTDVFTLEDVVCNESKIKEVDLGKRQHIIRESRITKIKERMRYLDKPNNGNKAVNHFFDSARKSRKPQRHHAYSHLRWMHGLKERVEAAYVQHVNSLPPGTSPIEMVSFRNRKLKEYLDEEGNDIHEEIDKYIDQISETNYMEGDEFEGMAPDVRKSLSKFLQKQRDIQSLHSAIEVFLNAVELRTGFRGLVLLGGPDPLNDGQTITVASCRGHTDVGGQEFNQYCKDYINNIGIPFLNWAGKCTSADEVEEIRRLTKLLANAQGVQTVTTGVNATETDTTTRTANEPLGMADKTPETPGLYRIDDYEPLIMMQDLISPGTQFGGLDDAPAPSMSQPESPQTTPSGDSEDFPSLPPPNPAASATNEPSIDSSTTISDSPTVIVPGLDLPTGGQNCPQQVDHTSSSSLPTLQPADVVPSQPESIVPDSSQGTSTVRRRGRPRRSEEEKQKMAADKKKAAEERKRVATEKKVAGQRKKAANKKKGAGEKENEEPTEATFNNDQHTVLNDPLSEAAHTNQLQHGNAPVIITTSQPAGFALTPTASPPLPPAPLNPTTVTLPLPALEQSFPGGDPAWTVEAEEFLRKHLKGPNTQHLVSQWLALEAVLGYPDTKNKIVSKEPIPNPLQVWLKNKKRTFDKFPDIPATLELSVSFRRWYTGLQPQWRRNLAIWPLSRDIATHPNEPWYLLKCGGQNGFVLILICLAWWCRGLQSIAEQKGFDIAVDDVLWTLNTILESVDGGSKLGKRRRVTGSALAAVRAKRDEEKNEPQPKRKK